MDFEDTIGHLYIVDIEFDNKNATKRELAYIIHQLLKNKKILTPVKYLFNY